MMLLTSIVIICLILLSCMQRNSRLALILSGISDLVTVRGRNREMVQRWMPISAVRHRVRQAWRRQIMPAFRTGDNSQLLAALILANTCLDEMLLAEGYDGESGGERVYQARSSFTGYERLCMARRLRHLAVHHLDFRLNAAACGDALASFAQALRDHGVTLDNDFIHTDLNQHAIDDTLNAMLPFHEADSWQGEASIEQRNRNRSTFIVPEYGATL